MLVWNGQDVLSLHYVVCEITVTAIMLVESSCCAAQVLWKSDFAFLQRRSFIMETGWCVPSRSLNWGSVLHLRGCTWDDDAIAHGLSYLDVWCNGTSWVSIHYRWVLAESGYGLPCLLFQRTVRWVENKLAWVRDRFVSVVVYNQLRVLIAN